MEVSGLRDHAIGLFGAWLLIIFVWQSCFHCNILIVGKKSIVLTYLLTIGDLWYPAPPKQNLVIVDNQTSLLDHFATNMFEISLQTGMWVIWELTSSKIKETKKIIYFLVLVVWLVGVRECELFRFATYLQGNTIECICFMEEFPHLICCSQKYFIQRVRVKIHNMDPGKEEDI